MTNGYEDFGKYLLTHLGFVDTPDDLDWNFIVRTYSKKGDRRSKPGLMWLNWTVCTYFGMDPALVRTERSRKRVYVKPRHIAQYLAIMLFGYTQEEVSEFYGIKNRSLITSNNGSVENLMVTDKYYKLDVENITQKLLRYDENEEPGTSTIGIPRSVQESEEREGDGLLVNRDRQIEGSD